MAQSPSFQANIAQFLLASAIPPPNPPAPTPFPVSAYLCQQIISKYIDLAELIFPLLNQPAPPRLIDSRDGPSDLCGPAPSWEKELTLLEFHYTEMSFAQLSPPEDRSVLYLLHSDSWALKFPR